MKAIRVHGPGGPEALVYEDVPDPVAGPGQALVRIEAIGLNFSERNVRLNARPGQEPTAVGGEAAGTIVSLAEPGEFRPGDRVAFNGVLGANAEQTGVPAAGPSSFLPTNTIGTGAYAEQIVVPVSRLILIPDNVSTKLAAATLLQGMTAHYLARSVWPINAGDVALVHAAAGGVGLLLCQMVKLHGGRVIGTVSSEDKARVARSNGADDVINYTTDDFEAEVKRLTDNAGVNVVYDSVGKDTFLKGFACLRLRGMMVSYGQASGVEPVNTAVLQRGSVFLTYPGLAAYTATREELVQRAGEVFGWVGSGALKVHIHDEFPLREAGRAQAALESRATMGKVLLIP